MADWEDMANGQGDLSHDRRGSVVGSNPTLAQQYWSKAANLQRGAINMVNANGGQGTKQTDKMFAQAALNRERALALGYNVTPGQQQSRRPGDRRTNHRNSPTRRGGQGNPGVGGTGGPPTGGPTRGNGKFF